MGKNKNNGVQIEILNWDEERQIDMLMGRGFDITEPGIVHGDQKSMYGIQSPIYCSDWSDDNAFAERYSCKCGDMMGKVFEGEVCPSCGSKIEFRDVDLSIFGWIVIKDHYIIHPIFYNMLDDIIGTTALNDIITYDKKVTKNGDIEQKKATSPFYGIGVSGLYNRFDEIIDYYKAKKKNKLDNIEELLSNRDKIFAHSIPVYSSVLRPLAFRGESFFYTSIDTKYNSIFTSSRLLNNMGKVEKRREQLTRRKRERMDVGNILSDIQHKLMKLWKEIFGLIDGKTGQIQGEILGGTLNFTSRCVIIPDPFLRADEIVLNYAAMLELYRYEIIATLTKMNKITENEAADQCERAKIEFNKKIFEVMKYLLKKRKPKVLINRNPTINYGSIMCVKVVDVAYGSRDNYTMRMPIQILPLLNADFDGDVLNIVSLKTKDLAKAYDKIFNPRKNMFVSRNTGLFNGEVNLYKDQMAGLYEFNNI